LEVGGLVSVNLFFCAIPKRELLAGVLCELPGGNPTFDVGEGVNDGVAGLDTGAEGLDDLNMLWNSAIRGLLVG
jgi:hypothetical protein